MSYTVEFTDQARADFRGIYEYIAFTLQSKINADRQYARIEQEIKSLSEMPERYKALDLDLGNTVRIVTVDNYCVLYYILKETNVVQILRILYGGRNIETEMKSDN